MQIQINNYAFINRLSFYGNHSPEKQDSCDVSKLVNKRKLLDSFIRMVRIDTTSNPEKAMLETPSTNSQRIFAQKLKYKLRDLGVQDVNIENHNFVTGRIPSNVPEVNEKIALFAHMDTKPPGRNIRPIIRRHYDGKNVYLNSRTYINKRELQNHVGKTLITSDGETILGADDKAGIAEILEALRIYKEHPELKHPEIKIAFTPDEECSTQGITKFNIKKFGADAGYTIDGDALDIIDEEYVPEYQLIQEPFASFKKNIKFQIHKDKENAKIEKRASKMHDITQKLIENAKKGLRKSGFEPFVEWDRGITDGSYLSMEGLPTANLGTGGHNGHLRTEYITLEDMGKSVENIINTMSAWAEKK